MVYFRVSPKKGESIMIMDSRLYVYCEKIQAVDFLVGFAPIS